METAQDTVRAHAARRLPNNSRNRPGPAPLIGWNDPELLAHARRAAGVPDDATHFARSHAIRRLFVDANMEPPTEWAVVQWYMRQTIPDRWRAPLVWLLMSRHGFRLANLFRKAAPSSPQ